jgi:hypothetical protein
MRILTLLLVGCAPHPLEGAAIDISDDLVPPYADGHQSLIVRVAVPCVELDGLGGTFRGTAMAVVPGDCPTLEIDPTSVTPTNDVIEVHDATTTIVASLGALLDVRQVEMTDTLCGGQSVTATWSHLDDLGDGDGSVVWSEIYPTLDGEPSGNWVADTTTDGTGFAFSVPTKGVGVPRPGSSGDGQVAIFLEGADTTGTVDCAPATCGYHFQHPALTTGRYLATCP